MPRIPAEIAKIRAELDAALDTYFMGPSTFLQTLMETPDAALAALKRSPEVFGQLRTYIGPATLKINHKAVQRLSARYVELMQSTRR